MNYRMRAGHLELEFSNGQKSTCDVNYISKTIYFSDEVRIIVSKYRAYQETPFDFPDMDWDEDLKTWIPYKLEHKDLVNDHINNFIKLCRRNQKCLVN